MSGPKVVRVRATRQEMIAESLARLRELADVISEWKRCLERYDAMTPEKAAKTEARMKDLHELHRAESWNSVIARTRSEIQFLRDEMEEARSAAIRRAEQARGRRRRLESTARTVANALAAAGLPVPAELDGVIKRALRASDGEMASLQAVVSRAFSQLQGPAEVAKASAAQEALAKRLASAPAARQTVADWAASQTAAVPIEERDRRLDALLAEVEVLDDTAAARSFLDRAEAIAAEVSRDQRALLTDSLILDVAAHCKARKAGEEATRLLRAVRADLRRFEADPARALEARIAAVLKHPDISEAKALAAEVQAWVSAETRRESAIEKRRAVLRGLAGLGYEVRESMATAWAEQGRIVVRNASSSGYGVEIGSTADAERLQMRAVAFSRPGMVRDKSRDLDMETSWCAEFERLRTILAEGGYLTELEKALPVGAVPLKIVDDDASPSEHREIGGMPLTRRLP